MSETKEVVVNKADQVLGQLLDRALNGVDKAVEFSQAQIPEVIEQLLMWKMMESVLWNVAALAVLVVLCVFQWLCFGKHRWCESFSEGDGSLGAAWFFSSAIMIVFVITFLDFDWLKIMVAPKLYLLEYAADFVK